MSDKFRFHILGLPHTVTSTEYNACAYTQKVLKFGKMMKARGHEIIHYGHEESNLICDEHVTVITNKDLEIAYGNYDWRNNFFKFDKADHAYQTFFKNAIREVGKRKQKLDFILPFWGSGVREVCDAHQNDLIVVEPGIGYAGGHWARWKVFESYAIMHAFYNMQGVGHCQSDWYDVVIPNYFDTNDFTFQEKKEDYMLFLGRVYSGKGVHVAVQASEAAGCKLVIAGQKPEDMQFPKHVEFVGYADIPTRKKLMAGAKGAYVPSMYIEPFGGVQIEMLMSGTPTITTDWGSFVENNLHGVTGYRCRTFDHFVWATENIERIDPRNCRTWAENFTLESVAPMYEEYFQNVLNTFKGRGWYERKHDRQNLNYLHRNYPKYPERVPAKKKEANEGPFADRLALYFKIEFDPNSILDIGNGSDDYVKPLQKLGLNANKTNIDQNIENNAELVLCIKLTDNSDSNLVDQIIDKVINATDKTLVWAATKMSETDVAKFVSAGLKRDTDAEDKLIAYCKNGYHMKWFLDNLLIFKK